MSTLERGEKIPSDDLLDRMTEVFHDTGLELHREAALERGTVTIPLCQENAGQLVVVLLALRARAPTLSSKAVRALGKAING
jgi:hypothetical protein